MSWQEKEISIAQVKTLLENGYEVEVDSPDGFIGITEYVEKGIYDEYVLYVNDEPIVRCNANHKFETSLGWMKAANIEAQGEMYFVTKDGLKVGYVIKTDENIPIVDIQVDHKNHRYYTNGVSSHNTGVGKSLAMCHFAAANLTLGYNVLYITLEMAEERIAERIDANLLDHNIAEIEELPKALYDRKVEKMKHNVKGRLMIKEYPTAAANVNHFRALLDELKMKKNFTPDIIYIDYLNIASSARLRMGNSVNSYIYIKSIAEELRGLAVEYEVPIVSATQTNRSGFSNSDVDMDSTSESFGLPMTADMMFAVMSSEDMQERGQYLIKQLKNRYVDPTFMKRFMVGVDYSKMRLYELENPLDGLYEDKEDEKDSPVFNNRKKRKKGKFDDFEY